MSLITIVEAAKQFNVTRPRIYRAIKKGELTATVSEDGVQLVQVQDLIRLFEQSQKKTVPRAVRKPVARAVRDEDNKIIKLLEEQLRKAEEDKLFLKQQIQDIRKDFEDYKLRIEHQEKADMRTGVTGNDDVKTGATLQKEHTQNAVSKQPEMQQQEPFMQPRKKGLLQRLVGEIFR